MDQGAAARQALRRGDWPLAQRLATGLMGASPAEGQFVLGVAAASTGRAGEALAHLQQAVAIEARGEYRAQLAKLLSLLRRDGEAAQVLREAEAALPEDALSLDTIGCVYARLGQHEAALPHFAAAVALEPANLEFRYNQAVTLNFLGRVDEADAALEALIALSPGDARAHHLLASLRKQSAQTNHVGRLETVHAEAKAGRDRLLTGYALAKELEDIGEEARAFATLCAVNAGHRRELAYDRAQDAANFKAMEDCWPAIRPADGAPQDAPVFIIGMPRTGTTLVDRILSSHPDMESAGELQAMPLAVKTLAGTGGRNVLDPETAMAAARGDMAALGWDYLRRATHHLRGVAPRFVDKFPGNFHYVGFIAHALPQARIVCLRRHPMDTVLANFRNLFAVSSRYYDYSYDLLDIAAYYAGFDRLMAFWRAAIPGRVMELAYEDLVGDQEGQTRALLAHCGLAWDTRCLAFQDNAAPVSTPSAAQVRRPIYRDSLARWRRHEAEMAPVRAFLEQQGIAVD